MRGQKSWLLAATGGLILVLTIAGSIYAVSVRKKSPGTFQQYYAKELNLLGEQIATIAELQDYHTANPPNRHNIDQYEEAVANTTGICRQMDGKYEGIKNSINDSAVRDKVNSVHALCHDLESVTDYAYRWSKKTRSFVLFKADNLSTEDVKELTDTISVTTFAIDGLKSDPIQDPALPEQVEYLKRVLNASNDPQKASQELKTEQDNFINARRYFWDNTIQMQGLRKSIAHLQDGFKS